MPACSQDLHPQSSRWGQELSFPAETREDRQVTSTTEVQGLSAAPRMVQLRGSFSPLLFGERSPSPVYPTPRQSRSGKELLQPAMVILDYKVVGDFFVVVV